MRQNDKMYFSTTNVKNYLWQISCPNLSRAVLTTFALSLLIFFISRIVNKVPLRNDNGAGMGRATPTPFSSRLYIYFPILVLNLGRGELVSPMPVYKRADNPIPVLNVFSRIMLLQNMGLWNFNKRYLGYHIHI